MKTLSAHAITKGLRRGTALLLTAVLAACAGPRQAALTDNLVARQPAGKESNGIEIVRMGHAASGMMLDLRYRITDFAKASTLLKQGTPLSVLDQGSGRVLTVAQSGTVGKLRSVPQKDDAKTVYWMFFVDAGGYVQPGSSVTLKIGAVEIKDIRVE